MAIIEASVHMAVGEAKLTGSAEVIKRAKKLLDESQEAITDETKDDITDFIVSKIDELTGLDINEISEFITSNIPGHLIEWCEYIIKLISRVLI